MNTIRADFKIRSRRGDEAESLEFSGKSASSRRRLHSNLSVQIIASRAEFRDYLVRALHRHS
jgi:hypothetical protein